MWYGRVMDVGLFTRLLVGLALLFLSIKFLSGALKELDPKLLRPVDNQYWMFLLAFAATVAVQSSSVTTSALVLIVASGQLSLAAGIGGIIGANVGTTTTAWAIALFKGMSPEARQVAVAHSALNLVLLIALPFSPYLALVIRRWF